MRFLPLVCVVLSACVPSNGSFSIPGEDGASIPLTSSPGPTGDTDVDPDPPTTDTDTGTPPVTGDTGEPADPCLSLPIAPLSYTWIDGARPSEEFVFTPDGFLVNVPDGSAGVFRTPYGAEAEFVSPFQAIELAGVRMLLDGDLALANEWDGSVERVNLTTGARTLIVGGLDSPNSLAVGPDGRLYIANYGSVVRVDPAAGDAVEVLADLPGSDLDGLTFAPDFSALYFNHDDGGEIGVIPLATDGTASPVEAFANVPVSYWSQLDGMATDVCGNLYAVRTDGELWRVTPDGQASLYAESTTSNAFTTAVSFGSGVGGWERDRLYMMDRNSAVLEIEVGVEGREEPHLP